MFSLEWACVAFADMLELVAPSRFSLALAPSLFQRSWLASTVPPFSFASPVWRHHRAQLSLRKKVNIFEVFEIAFLYSLLQISLSHAFQVHENVLSFFKSLSLNRSDGVVVRASASQSVDLGFIPLVESYQKT